MWNRRATCLATLAAVLPVAAAVSGKTTKSADPNGLVAHEWGTFTSIAGADGRAISWQALDSHSDLPCFVDRLRYAPNVKAGLAGTVRMETPVIYFYAPRKTTVDVDVRFDQGVITEWYPRAAVSPAVVPTRPLAPGVAGTARWDRITVAPDSRDRLPREDHASHYYAARETDAALVQAADQREKFIFYRGVGQFAVPILARLDANDRAIATALDPGTPLGTVMRFERRDERIGFSVRREAGAETMFDPPRMNAGLNEVTAAIERILIAEGLFPREARAMIETWRTSWFEEGSRIFYIAPRRFVDKVLPLSVRPEPVRTERVFVGRIELLTAPTRQALDGAFASADAATAARYGRFVEAFARLMHPAPSPEVQARIGALNAAVYRRSLDRSVQCPAPSTATARPASPSSRRE